MIHNSIGISTCKPAVPCTMQYFWRDPLASAPHAFFDTGKDDLWYWPLDGIREGDAVYLALLTVRHRPGSSPNDPFGFQITGSVWATVTNLDAPPAQWRIVIKPLSQGSLWAGVSLIRHDGFLLLYSQISQGSGKGCMIVLRVPLADIGDPAAHWQYLASDRTWQPFTPDMHPLHVIEQGISEMTVRYHAAAHEWVAISPGPEPFSGRIVARIAHSPLGPWSAPATVFTFPETTPGDPLYDKDTFCYATKEHIEFGSSRLVLSYACNSSLAKAINNMQIYRPQIVVVNLPH